MSNERQWLVFENIMFHILEDFDKFIAMIFHGRVRIKFSVISKANWNFKLSHALGIGEYFLKLTFGIKYKLNHFTG